METIPGLTDLLPKLLSQCGLASAILAAAVIWLAIQLAKANSRYETANGNYIKVFNEQVAIAEKLAVSQAKVEGMLSVFTNRTQHDGD